MKVDWSKEFNALPIEVRTIGLAMELRTRLQQLDFEEKRLRDAYYDSRRKIREHRILLQRDLDRLSNQ